MYVCVCIYTICTYTCIYRHVVRSVYVYTENYFVKCWGMWNGRLYGVDWFEEGKISVGVQFFVEFRW